MTSRVALATASTFPDLDEDGPALLAALAEAGIEANVRIWDDPDVDWDAYDLVVIRSTWDYWLKHEDYLAWTRSVPRLANAADVVAWNTDKTYLRRLEAAGIPIVPTTWLLPGDQPIAPDYPFVVKPTISAGARDTAAYPAGSATGVADAQALLAAGRPVMIQPYVEAVDSTGETSVLVFAREVSHAARKAPILEVGRPPSNDINSRYFVSPCEPTKAEAELALKVVGLVEGWGHDLLYARVDLLPGPMVIELEVTEPSLFLRHSEGSPERFAAAVLSWLERSG